MIFAMNTKIVPESEIFSAIHLLLGGENVAIPTETVYGLAATIFDESALKNIFTIKGRPSDNPLICHVANLDQVDLMAENIPREFYELSEIFWPGPLTLVVPKRKSITSLISPGLDTIAIRMPAHKTALEIISHTGPLAAPSANLSGSPSPTTANDVFEDLSGKIPMIVDGGSCRIGIESTVLSLVDQNFILLRPGSITKESLEFSLNRKIKDADASTKILSPGMKYRHYAPKAKVNLCFHPSQLQSDYILSPKPEFHMRLLSESTLYAELRRADRLGSTQIDIDCSEEILKNQALMNRLLKASSS